MPIEPRLNPKPRNQIGAQAVRPARGKRDGQEYISEAGISGWDAEAGVWRMAPVGPAGGAPNTEIPSGNLAGGFSFSPHFTFDAATGIFTVEDHAGTILLQINGTTGQTTYGSGQRSVGVPKPGDFIADIAESMDYEIVPGAIVTLRSTDPVGTVFQFHVGAGAQASPAVLTPNNGIQINGQATFNVDRDYASQYVRKMLDGSWHAGQ